jgi:hypothetical protein
MSGANVSMSGHMTMTSRGLERRIVLQEVQDRVADDLDLAGASVARVDLDRPVVGGEREAVVGVAGKRRAGRRSVGADVRLDPGQQRVVALLDRMVVIDVVIGGRENELELARVAAPGGEERVGGPCGGDVVAAADDGRRPGHALPEHRRGMEKENVDVAARGDGAQDADVGDGQPGQAEDRDPLGELEPVGVALQDRAGLRQVLGRSRTPDPIAQVAPELGLPVGRVPVPPPQDHLRAVQRVAIEQVGEVADGGEAARPSEWVRRVPEVGAQRAQPRLCQVRVDDLEQRPHQPFRAPRVLGRVDPGRRRDRIADQSIRERELDVRADPRPTAGRRRRRRVDIRCVSQRSIPRVGTAMTSGAKGSAGGSASSVPSASTRPSARSAR